MSTFHDRLDYLLYQNKMNKSELARRLEVATSTVHRWWERGYIPEYPTLVKLSEVFGVTVPWLTGLTDEQEKKIVIHEVKENELSELDEELVRILRSLTPQQLQRVKDFLAGLRG